MAARSGEIEILKLLKAYTENRTLQEHMSRKNRVGLTPLHIAYEQGHADAGRWTANENSSHCVAMERHQTSYAAYPWHPDLIDDSIQHQVDIEIRPTKHRARNLDLIDEGYEDVAVYASSYTTHESNDLGLAKLGSRKSREAKQTDSG